MTAIQKAHYKEHLGLYKRAVNQQRNDKNKVYSLHKPFTEYISKGKAHKPYEFSNKVGLIIGGKKGKKMIFACSKITFGTRWTFKLMSLCRVRPGIRIKSCKNSSKNFCRLLFVCFSRKIFAVLRLEKLFRSKLSLFILGWQFFQRNDGRVVDFEMGSNSRCLFTFV